MAAIDDDDKPKKKLVHEIGQDLTLLSVGELTDRVALLKQEIARLEAVDDDEQSFHQGPGAVADPNIVRWQVKMKIVMTLMLTWLLKVCSKIAGIGAGLDLSPPPPAPSSISASQNPLFLTVLRHP